MERSYMSEVSSCEVERVTVRQNYTRVARAREVMRISITKKTPGNKMFGT